MARSNSQALTFVVIVVFFAVMFGSSLWFYGGDLDLDASVVGDQPEVAAPTSGPTPEQMARMAELRQNPGWRLVHVPAFPGGIDVFRSGRHDTYRGVTGPFNFRIRKVDPSLYGIWYNTLNDLDGKLQFVSLRFCNRLSFMNNPDIDQLLEDLQTLPEKEPLTAGAVSLGQSQSDCELEFIRSAIALKGDAWALDATVVSHQTVRREFANFCYVLIDPEQPDTILDQGYFALNSLIPNGESPFSIPLQGDWSGKQPLLRFWLVFTASSLPSGIPGGRMPIMNRSTEGESE